jgi:hypothetical protein
VANQIVVNFSGNRTNKGEYVPVFPLVLGQARRIKEYDHIPRCGRCEKTCLLEKESTVNGKADGICRGGGKERTRGMGIVGRA